MSERKIYITFDYELFFGKFSGSIEKSILDPTNRLIEISRKRNVAFTFFVDAGMLRAMKKFSPHAPELIEKYEKITEQLRLLKNEGHSIQLHIHPHWEDATYVAGNWIFDVTRYRLNQYSSDEVIRIISEYQAELVDVVGGGIHAFRAGGWCIQPFTHIAHALKSNGIRLDSTIYRDGCMHTSTHQFDFRRMPSLDSWHFETDPMLPIDDGWFKEIPISVIQYSRAFYLSMVFHRLFKTQRFQFIGDGTSVGGGLINTFKMIASGGSGVVTLDGFRVQRLLLAFNEFVTSNVQRSFVVIGHPKALCDQSFTVLDSLAAAHNGYFHIM